VHAWRAPGTCGGFPHPSCIPPLSPSPHPPPSPQSEYESGQGTHVRGPYVCASLVGTRRTVPPTAGTLPRLEVLRAGAQPVIPTVGSIVTARVVSITPRLASVDILAVGAAPVPHRCPGVIRNQDVRATEIDKVQLHLCFRPGDLVRAEVLSLGDARSYFLTTAKNDLGVVEARSVAGERMVPVSWQEMQCPKTRVVEKRKVAKVDNSADDS
jgi:exosome complex component CSL4